jgi:hypothetical protein
LNCWKYQLPATFSIELCKINHAIVYNCQIRRKFVNLENEKWKIVRLAGFPSNQFDANISQSDFHPEYSYFISFSKWNCFFVIKIKQTVASKRWFFSLLRIPKFICFLFLHAINTTDFHGSNTSHRIFYIFQGNTKGYILYSFYSASQNPLIFEHHLNVILKIITIMRSNSQKLNRSTPL